MVRRIPIADQLEPEIRLELDPAGELARPGLTEEIIVFFDIGNGSLAIHEVVDVHPHPQGNPVLQLDFLFDSQIEI